VAYDLCCVEKKNVCSVQCVCHLGTKLQIVIYFYIIARHCVRLESDSCVTASEWRSIRCMFSLYHCMAAVESVVNVMKIVLVK